MLFYTIYMFVGTFLSNLLLKSVDSSVQNIHRIIQVLSCFAHKITPNYYSKLCGTTGLLVFFIKDILEYYGIIVEKKSNAQRVLKTYSDLRDYLLSIKQSVESKADKIVD
jgi:hypothetical protein